jgi:regulator of sigma E protease
METFFIRVLQLVMSLSLLIIVHESGHFLFSRLFKVRVERFALFFHPWFRLFTFKPKKSETEYILGWIPLGGYVKISGMIDESMDTEQMKQPMQPYEFRSKPAWQRLLIMTAGVIFNFILALIIYSMILFTWGDAYIPVQKAPLGMEFNEAAKSVGFQDGDVLLAADGQPFERYDASLISRVVDARVVTVLRNGQEAAVYIPEGMMDRLLTDSVRFAAYRKPYVIDSIIPHSPAAAAGLQAGDSIVTLDEKLISFEGFLAAMELRKSNADTLRQDSIDPRQITLGYIRAGVASTVTLKTDSLFRIGTIAVSSNRRLMPMVDQEYGFFASFPAGISLGVSTLRNYVNSMKHLFSKEGAKQLGGFGTIGSIFPSSWDWYQFWYMTAFLSIILAFMNILPIPALDGGHVLFLIYEMITRRKPSDKFMERAQMVGMFLLFALLIWANLNDIIRYFF